MGWRLPTFFVIGAAKSGTTALYGHLMSHPEVFMSRVKEPRYFAYAGGVPKYTRWRTRGTTDQIVTDLASYEELFASATTEKALGEVSVVYMYLPWCAERMRRHVPEARLIAILRHPAERAYSQYLHAVRDGMEPLRDFEEALDAEPERIRDNWSPMLHYAARGRYHEQLVRYVELFGRDRLLVHLYDDYVQDPASVVRDVYRFVGVDPTFTPELARTYNRSGVPKNRALYTAFQSVVAAARRGAAASPLAGRLLHSRLSASVSAHVTSLMLARPRMSDRARARLLAYYAEDVAKLEGLLGRDLSAWK